MTPSGSSSASALVREAILRRLRGQSMAGAPAHSAAMTMPHGQTTPGKPQPWRGGPTQPNGGC